MSRYLTDEELSIIRASVPKYGGGHMKALIAEVETLRQTLDATEKERDQWHDAALDRRQALHDADALRTGVHLALSPEGGVNGWRPSRGVDALIDLALTVREDAEDAERGAAACDQIVALLDGIPVEAPCPEAARVAALLAEVERLRADLDALSRAVGQALVAASLAADETLADPMPHIIVSTVTRLRAEALGQRAEASFLRACVPPVHPTDYGHEAWAKAVRAAVAEERAAVVAWLREHWSEVLEQTPQQTAKLIERGEHRREEK